MRLFLLWGMIVGEITRKDGYGRPYKNFIGSHICRHFFAAEPRIIEVANDNRIAA